MSAEVDEIGFNTKWREEFITALEAKLQFLYTRVRIAKEFHKDPKTLIGEWTDDRITVRDIYEFHSYVIEAHELEHRIYYEKKALAVWKSQVEKTATNAESTKVTEAIQNFEKVLRIVEKNAPQHERLQRLLDSYKAIQVIDTEQSEAIYAQFTRALQMLNIAIE